MPIEMPKGLPFSVDTWTPSSNRKRYHFLTHCHKDHIAGISSNSTFPIYSTRIAKTISLHLFPQLDESLFVEIEVGETVVIDDPDGPFSVMAFDANHCPGAVMFLFKGEFGNVLHTGDCRLTPECLHCLPMKFITKKGKETFCLLDYLILDCTFGRCSLKLPSKQSAIQQVINCIWKHPSAPVVYLACDMLGQEEILVEVSRIFGSKIYVDKTNNSECFHALLLIAPEILTQDASSRFQVTEGFPRLNERASQKFAEARASLQAAPLFIRPSEQWYASTDRSEMTRPKKPRLSEAVMDEFGIWHVCYSMHSSREELEWALQLLQPKWVISSTPLCRAMELEYVKKHCYKTCISADDPLWKLLRLSPGKSVTSSASAESEQLLPANDNELKLDSPSQSSTRNITLFGRARMGIQDIDLLRELNHSEEVSVVQDISIGDVNAEKSSEVLNRDITVCVDNADLNVEKLVEEDVVSIELNVADLNAEKSSKVLDINRDIAVCIDNADLSTEKSVEEDVIELNRSFGAAKTGENSQVVEEEDALCCGSSTNLNPSLRRLYRSMNVPVPRPLPSLVELMAGSKRVKVGSGLNYGRPKYRSSSAEYCLHERRRYCS